MLEILFTNPILFIILIASLIICITIHEFAHAFVADKLGDSTARYLGRVTLDPRSHIDFYGLLFLVFTGFGWGRPVPFNEINLKNPKRDIALIAIAGPLSNFILAIILSIMLNFLSMWELLDVFLSILAYYNVLLGVFNLLPFFPLDGFKVVTGLLPFELAYKWKQTENYGIFILILLIFTDTLSNIILPTVNFISNFLKI